MVNEDDMLGLIIITVVCCAVGTSIVWVVIIYQTRRRLNAAQNGNRHPTTVVSSVPPEHELETHLYLDTSSQHSKDSGTGDSTNPSNDQLQICIPGKSTRSIRLPFIRYTFLTSASFSTGQTVRCIVNNGQAAGNAESEEPLLRYTNHERLPYNQLHHEHEIIESAPPADDEDPASTSLASTHPVWVTRESSPSLSRLRTLLNESRRFSVPRVLANFYS